MGRKEAYSSTDATGISITRRTFLMGGLPALISPKAAIESHPIASRLSNPPENSPAKEPIKHQFTRFAVLADGGIGEEAREVATAIKKLDIPPHLVVLAGDVSYSDSSDSYRTLREEFFPELELFVVPGDHDKRIGRRALANAFGLKQYNHDRRIGAVHLFGIDSCSNNSKYIDDQMFWLWNATTNSDAFFKFLVVHYPPFSVGEHGSYKALQLPYHKWGIKAVFSGDNHNFAIVEKGGEKNGIDFGALIVDSYFEEMESPQGTILVPRSVTQFISRKNEKLVEYEIPLSQAA